MKIDVGSRLVITEPTDVVLDYCRTRLILDNPEYYKKERMGLFIGDTPRNLRLYETVGEGLWLPFGCLRDIWKMHPVADDYTTDFADFKAMEYESHIDLYPYQQTAVEKAIKAKNGVLVMPCGAGKTQCGLEIISRIGGRALWLTHTQDLLSQSMERANAVLDVVNGRNGTITAGKIEIGTHITFATVQTMAKKIDTALFRNCWDVIIVDECHHAAGTPTKLTQFYTVISRLAARYKIGLTATPKRADGLEQSMFYLLGDTIHEVSREEVAHTTCPIKVQTIETGWIPEYNCILMGDGTIDYNKVIDAMIHDEDRYNVVFGDILGLQGATMVLANRVEYLDRMCADMRGCGKRAVCLSGKGQRKAVKAERKAALQALNNGELDYVFCTYQLAAEGLDVPKLRYIVFSTPEQNERVVMQSIGRAGRKADGKEYGTVVDFVDEFGLYKSWYKKRLSVYKKLNCGIIE